jgi:hypothetical protein
MAATIDWESDHGPATGSPAKGTTRALGRSDYNWKNIDDATTTYSLNPITDGNNSFEIWAFAKLSGLVNQVLAGKFAHTVGPWSTGQTLKGVPNCTGDGDKMTYTTPSTTANALLTVNMTTAIAIASGVSVCFGPTGPEATGKAASMSTIPCYTNYLPMQLQTSGSASGDTPLVTLTLQYQEN